MYDKTLLHKIGFTEEEQRMILHTDHMQNQKIADIASAYMCGEMTFLKALSELKTFCDDKTNIYFIHLLFVLECCPLLAETYKENNIPDEIYTFFLNDIRYKVTECLDFKKTLGIFVIEWYELFFNLSLFSFGRLQFEIRAFDKEPVKIGDFKIEKGDFILKCHIPSAGPLKHELCVEALKKAHTFFKEKLKQNILPVLCTSWLLYPPYRELFGEKSNTIRFCDYYDMLESEIRDGFADAWRIFHTDDISDVSLLPCETTMQKNFIEYISQKKTFGAGTGILLFDGETILTGK